MDGFMKRMQRKTKFMTPISAVGSQKVTGTMHLYLSPGVVFY